MKNPLLRKWENTLQSIFDRIDRKLEDKYGGMFPLRPNRPEAGKGVTPDADGLFDLGVSFSVGIGSELGPGYVFRVRLATMRRVPDEFMQQVEEEVVELLNDELPQHFPGRDLRVGRDGRLFKIYGDLDLN